MVSKDIFGNGNNEELFDSSLLDSSQEDIYGLNAGNKVNNPGTEPLTAEIERLSTDNINLTYTDNIGDDTDNIVSSPILFNESSSQNQLLGQQATNFNKTSIDSLTGNNKNNPLVGTFELSPNSDSNSSIIDFDIATFPIPMSASAPTPKYAIRTEKQVIINNGSDLDGNPLDISDDALIYAAKGFTINNNITLPVKRDENGNPLTDSSGKLILVDNAVTVAPDYTTANANNNQYANLIPPQVVDEQVIDIPDVADLKQQKLDSVIAPGTSTVTFNAAQNTLNNSQDWANKFPPPGTESNPTVVRVTGGGLNIPDNVNASNYVITVENGDINFNGDNHNFDNVVLIADNGNINLANMQATDLSVFADSSINMNSSAEYVGSTILATKSASSNINFNGKTANTNSDNNLRVVSSGIITFNAASDTRGIFESAGDFTFNNNSTLYGTIAAKGDITFYNGASVIYADATVDDDNAAPIIAAALVNDTAPNNTTNTDGITSDATVSGNISNFSDSVRLRAGFDDTDIDDYVDITADISSTGNFNLDLSQLASINRASLEDGTYSLKLLLFDLQGNQLSSREVNFTLDTSNPILALNAPLDGGEHSNRTRLIGTVSDTGSGLFNTSYSLDGQASSPLTISNQGTFDQALVPTGLINGPHDLTLSVFDIAGNSTQKSANFTVSDDFIIGSTGTQGWGIKTNDSVILGEQNSFVTQTAMQIELGQNKGKRQLEFEIDAQFDTTDSNTASEDRLSLYLVDSINPDITLLDKGEPGTALFSLSGANAEFTPGLVNYDGNRVRVDLTSLSSQTSGSLLFQLINNDNDTGSVVQIKDITNTVDTEAINGPVFPTDIDRAEIGGQINLDTFNTSSDVELLLSNVRLDSDTGTYTADLQVRNNGTTTLGRELAVVLTNLPSGVSLNNASGTHPGGSPYINLSNAIQPGGLNPKAISDAVQIVFDNPSLTRFDLQPVFLTGAPEQPPQLAPVASQSVMPGGRLEIPLIATDPNGDPISFSLRSDTPLPKGELTGDGTLVFTPSPDDIGTFDLTIVASAGGVDVTQDVTITVEPDPITTTRISGVIQNTDQAALAGVVIELGGVQTTTDANGYFQLEFNGELPSDTLKVRAELLAGNDAYPFIAEKLPLVLEHDVYAGVNNVIGRPIYLPVLDTANAVAIDPNADTIVTTDTIPGASVFVAAGSLKDQQGNAFTGGLSITEVPADLTPAALPENLRPDLVVTIQPGEMVFTTPAPLSLPNRAGYVAGLEMDLWSINPNTGLFDKVGVGRVSDDGSVIETISGGIRNSSWHFVAPPPEAFGDLNDPEDDPRNKDKECDYCEATQPINSDVELHSGTVKETHNLVTYDSLGKTRGLSLNYDSLRADPRPIVHFGYDNVRLISTSSGRLVAKLKVKQGDFTYQVTGTTPGKNGLANGEHVWKIPAGGGNTDAALQMDMRSLSSGKYEYELTTGLQAFTGTEFNGSSTTSTGGLINVNSVDSVFGSGWSLAGLQEIVENEDGSLLLIDGDGSQFLFEAPALTGSSYVSPSFDFSTLERVNGTFRRTMKDGTVYQFDAQNKLELVRDPNGNETQYRYNTGGKLSKIIDPVGLETTFTYTNGRVSSITDPGNRITELKYDTKGNLIKITDPDESSRNWEYDNSHRMTAAIDKRGDRGEDIYDAYGRVKSAVRPDGTVVKVNPVQTQGLNRSGQTVNPFNAPVAKELGDAEASYADGNGNVTRTKLDQAGQAISSIDGAGFLPGVERNDNNLVTKSTSARGYVTEYTYDDKGNVLSIKEEIPIPFQETDNDASNDLFLNRIYKTGYRPKQVVTADLNGDGFLDLVTAHDLYNDRTTDISTLLGNGDGTFGSATNFKIENSPDSIAVGDMNGDGFLDIVSVNNYYNTISMLLGDGSGSFTATTDIDVGYDSSFFVLGDLDNDADLDIVVASGGGYGVEEGSLSVLSNNGDATFSETTNYVIEEGPEKVALGDIDGNGSLDLVTANAYGSSVSVLLNNGDATFAQTTDYTVGEAFASDIALGDVNGDGRQDIVTANSYFRDSKVSVLLNEGDGTFTDSTDYVVETSAHSVTLGDVNGDGRQDIVITNNDENGLSVLLQNEDGTFAGNADYIVGNNLSSVVLGDVNGDSLLDLLAANYGDASVSVLLNKGDGTFKTETDTTDYDIGFRPKSVVVGDVNQDFIPDVVVGSYGNIVSVRLGNGDGTFSNTINSTIGTIYTRIKGVRIEEVALEDVNEDGLLDLVATIDDYDSDASNLLVLLGNGDGTFVDKTEYTVGKWPRSVALEDINDDGRQDIVTGNYSSDSVSVQLGNGNGTFAQRTDYNVGKWPQSVTLGDVNGDGRQDIVTANLVDSVSVLLGNGDGTFGVKTDYTSGFNPKSVVLGDLNGDGRQDIVTANESSYIPSVSVLLNNGDGTFASNTDYVAEITATSVESVALGDVNRDGYLDIVAANSNNGYYSRNTVSVFLGNGDGSFDSKNRLDFAVGRETNSIALSDFDLDGDLDFVTANYGDENISVRLNNTQSGVSIGTAERRYTYDSTFNQVTSVTDELGRITLYDIDPNNGNMFSTTRVVGEVGGDDDLVTSYTYTTDGQIDTMTDALGRLTDYDYNNKGRLTKTTFAKGTVDEAVQQFEYDAAGNLTASIDENENRTEYEYDELNRLIKTTYAKGTVEQAVEIIEYDDAGNQIATVDANNNRTEYEYDKMNQLVKTTEADPDGSEPLVAPITTYKYDQTGNLTSVIDPLKQETKYRYDARNRLFETIYADNSREKLRYDFDDNLVASIDANGNQTNMVYDARDRLIRTTDPLQQLTSYEYDATNQLIAFSDANQHKTKYDYDDLGRQVAFSDARNGVTTTEYNKVGNVVAVTDANQNTTNFTYDNRDRQTIITDAEQQITTTTYDDAGNVISVTDAEDDTTTFSYDARNRNIGITDPLNRTTTYTYDDVNNLIAVEDALNRVTEYEYDALNRNTVVENALGDTVVTTYDAADNVTSTTDELKRKTRYKYDKRNRLTTTIDPLNHQTTRKYDGNSNLIALTDALNQTTLYEYDELDRQKKITDAESQVTSFNYDKVGNLETVTDPEQNTTTYTYDELDRLKTEENELGKIRSYDYDAVGNLIATTDRNQRKRSYTYDRVDRQKEEKWLDSQGNAIRTISYDYDKVGRLTNTDDPDSSYSYTYDSAGQLIKVDNAGTPGVNNVVLDYTYDKVGNLKTVTDTIDGTQSGIEEFTYDDLNRVTRITQSGNGVADKRVDMTYDAASQLKGINRYADLASTQLVADSSYDYDVASRLKELKHFKGTDVLAAYGFDYDAGNRITSFSSPDGTSAYSYDLTNQLTGTDHSYQNSENYSYDDNGNRTNDGYDTGTDNRLLTDGKYNYSYDDEGNRTQRVEIATGEVTEYSWDYRNRLTEVVVKDANGNVIKTSGYAYDMLDRRIAKEVDPDGDGVATASVERFVYDGEHIALTFDGDGTQTHRYLHGPMIDQVLASENASGEVLWALTDNQGTVRDVVDNDGTVVNHITYDSFGKVTGESNENVDFRFGYTGREFDEETGQYYYRARYYDPATGQFINQDPIGFAGGDANLYRYVFNSPINFNDPSGEAVVFAIPLAVKGVAILAAGAAYILSNPQAREVAQELPRRIPKPTLPSLPPFTPPLSDDLSPNRFPTQPKDDSKSEPNKIDGTPTDGECNPQPQPPDCKPKGPAEEIAEEVLEDLIQEAIEFQELLYNPNAKGGGPAYKNTVTAVGLAQHNLTEEIKTVVTNPNGDLSSAQRNLAEQRGYKVVKTKGLGKSGWHAEGRLMQWAFNNNRKIIAMGVSKGLCPDCAKDIDTYKVRNNNQRLGDIYFKQNPKKRPEKRPKPKKPDDQC